MKLKGLSLAAMSAALVLSMSPVLTLSAAAEDSNGRDCGWYNVNGQLVFRGTCPHDTSEDTNSDAVPETAPQAT